MIDKNLQKIGLSNKQAKVYTACLEIGHGSAQRIAQTADLPKSTTYDTLQSLVKEGLVKVYLKKSRKYFTATDPIIFQNKLQSKNTVLTSLLPELLGLYHGQEKRKPKTRFYEGKAGVKVVLDEILAEATSIISVASADVLVTKLSEYFPAFPKQRTKKGISIRLIMPDGPEARERQARGSKELRKVKIINTNLPIESAFFIWNYKLAMITLEEDITVSLIESRDLTTTFKAMFELLWQQND